MNGRCSDRLLAHSKAHCPGHWQLHTGLAADADKAGTALLAVLVSSCRGFHLACSSVTCSHASYPMQCLVFLVSTVPLVPAAQSVRKGQHAVDTASSLQETLWQEDVSPGILSRIQAVCSGVVYFAFFWAFVLQSLGIHFARQ